MREVHLKTTRFPISRKPEVGFLRELDTFYRHGMKMLQTDYQVSGRRGTNPEIRIRCYNCASELRLSLRLGIHFNKSLINIFQLV